MKAKFPVQTDMYKFIYIFMSHHVVCTARLGSLINSLWEVSRKNCQQITWSFKSDCILITCSKTDSLKNYYYYYFYTLIHIFGLLLLVHVVNSVIYKYICVLCASLMITGGLFALKISLIAYFSLLWEYF